PHVQRHRASAPVGTLGGDAPEHGADALHGLGGRAPRAPLRRLLRAVAVVGRRARGFLGRHLGVLRRSRLKALRARARLARDARHELVRGSRAQLRRERPAGRQGPASGRDRAHLRAAPAVIAFLAVSSIGAVWSSAAPEFGARSVIDRFAQIEPKVLLTVDGYRHGGKDFDRTAVVRGILAELPTVEHVVVLPYLSPEVDPAAVAPDALAWSGLLEQGRGQEPRFEQLPFDHPLWVLYSSGTTGLPKAIVQSQGGILVEQ